MASSNLIRLGGLAAMVGSVAWVAGAAVLSQGVSNISVSQGLDILTVVFLTLGAMAAVAALHALQRKHYGWRGALSSFVAFIGLAIIAASQVMNFMVTVPEINFPPVLEALELVVGLGPIVATVGILALGIVTIAAGVLPWWCGIALIAASPLAAFVEYVLLQSLLWALWPTGAMWPDTIAWAASGLPWAVVGYSLFGAGARLSEQPSRVR